MRTLQEWLGHCAFATTLGYADYAPSELEREWATQRSRRVVWYLLRYHGWRCRTPPPTMKAAEPFFEMELAGLEPATSWVRYRVRTPNRGDLSSLRCSKFS